MTTIPLKLMFVAAFFTAATAYGNVPGVHVTVKSKSGGKLVDQAVTDARGHFATKALQPGSYHVEFRSPKTADMKSKQLAILISAGKDAPRQALASGNHMASGVAVEMELGSTAKLSGRVTRAVAAAAHNSGAAAEGMEKVRANVKVMNGKRYVWVPGPIGSNIGGKWIEEGTEGAVVSTSNRKGGDAEVLRRVQDHSGNIGSQWDGFGSPDR